MTMSGAGPGVHVVAVDAPAVLAADAVATQTAEPPAVGHDHAAVARLLHALAEPHRLSMVHLLARSEHRVVDLTGELGLAQSTVSVHLATLREAGLVDVRREGRSWYVCALRGRAHPDRRREDVETTRGAR